MIKNIFVIQNGKTPLDDRAIYYSRVVGRRRNYRNSYPIPMYGGLVLKTFKSKQNAQKLCDYTNETLCEDFVVREVEK